MRRTRSPPAAAGHGGGETDAEQLRRPDAARLAPHVAHFVKTARAGGYDHTTFHRIIAGGIIQGGDPLSKVRPRRSSTAPAGWA